MHWTVYLHHDEHIHTFLELDGVTGGSFTAQDYGPGTYSYEIDLTVTDSSGLTDTTSVNLPIDSMDCPTIIITPSTLPDGAVGTPYSETVVASGGNPPYGYSVSAGSLPPGLSLNTVTGEISGHLRPLELSTSLLLHLMQIFAPVLRIIPFQLRMWVVQS